MTPITLMQLLRRGALAGALMLLSGCSFNLLWGGEETVEEETPAQQEQPAADLGAAQPGRILSVEPHELPEVPSTAPAPLVAAPAPALKPAVPPVPESKSGVEVVFQVPLQPVQYYHFYYGTEAGSLDGHVRVPVEKLEKLDDPVHGPVYRYVIRGASAHEEVFVALRAENQNGLSDPTPPMSIPPKGNRRRAP